jgi:protein gp37
MAKTKIEWAHKVWNFCIGCLAISIGCLKCYAKEIAEAMQKQGVPKYRDGFEPRFFPHLLDIPKNDKEPSTWFVNSMSDFFHEAFTIDMIQAAVEVMRATPWHVYIILTKRHERMLELDSQINWPENVILGVTIESDRWCIRADYLRKTKAKHKVISAEPLLESLPNLNLSGITWIITGGESGKGARPFDPAWALEIRDLALTTGAAFFHKQNGGVNKYKTGNKIDGKTYLEYPQIIQELFVRREAYRNNKGSSKK